MNTLYITQTYTSLGGVARFIIPAEDPTIADIQWHFYTAVLLTLRESIAWMASTTKRCIWQGNPLVREGANFLYVSIKKVIDLETFGLPSGSTASSSLLSSETLNLIRFLMENDRFLQNHCSSLSFFYTFAQNINISLDVCNKYHKTLEKQVKYFKEKSNGFCDFQK